MDSQVLLVIILVIVIVVGVNGVLLLAFRGKTEINAIKTLQRTAKAVRNPWKDEEENLAELSSLVEKLQAGKEETHPTESSES